LHPIENPVEMGSSRLEVAHLIAGDAALKRAYEGLFGALPPLHVEGRFPAAARPVREDPDHGLQRAWSAMTEARAQNAAALIAELDAVFATKPLAEWKPIFDATTDFWWSPVQNLEAVMADPQVHAAGGFVEVPDGDATTLLPNSPADFHGTPASPRWMAPALGQHSDELLRELGKNDSERKALFEKGVVV
jgi:crotonobetainyl-CoA:carnitine CoA-transferase CaiB-like acyl-CoA transferase